MSPGSIGKLATEYDPAFRVRFEGSPPPQAALYWRGPVLNDFDGFTWRREPIEVLHRAATRDAGRAGALSHHARAHQPAMAVRARHASRELRGATCSCRPRPAAVGQRADHQHHELRRGLAPGNAHDRLRCRTLGRRHETTLPLDRNPRARALALRAARAHRRATRSSRARCSTGSATTASSTRSSPAPPRRLGGHHAVRQQARVLRPLRLVVRDADARRGSAGARRHGLSRRRMESRRRLPDRAAVRRARVDRSLARGQGWTRIDPTAVVAPGTPAARHLRPAVRCRCRRPARSCTTTRC